MARFRLPHSLLPLLPPHPRGFTAPPLLTVGLHMLTLLLPSFFVLYGFCLREGEDGLIQRSISAQAGLGMCLVTVTLTVVTQLRYCLRYML